MPGGKIVNSIDSSLSRLRWVETSKRRSDSISSPKKFDTHRIEPVGREDVQNSSANREFARQFHGGSIMKTVFGQPASNFFDARLFTPTRKNARLPCERFTIRNRLQKALNTCKAPTSATGSTEIFSAIACGRRRFHRQWPARWEVFPKRENVRGLLG